MEDMISQLPGDILTSIITPFPTKEAVRTSILSKRWRNIYKSVSAINVAFACRHSDEGFDVTIDGLHKFSQLHSGFIRSFKCSCFLTQSYSHAFEESMCSLGKYIEKLDLQFSHSECFLDFVFPWDLLSHMPCLKYFKLRYCSLQPNFSSHCNSLETLRLSKVKVVPGSLESILSNCLNLSTLLIRNCKLPSKLCLRGPQLKCIMIIDWSDLYEIELHAVNLITFELHKTEDVDILFDSVPQLQHIYLVSFKYFQKLGRDWPHLKSIHLLCWQQLFDNHIEQDIIYKGGIMFNNVTRLELSVQRTSRSHADLSSLMPILHSCPILQEFHLALKDCFTSWTHFEESVVVHRELRKVDISGFRDQCKLVLYILKSAVALQQLHISSNSKDYYGFGQWEEHEMYLCSEKLIEKSYQCIRAMEPQAASKTVQVMLEKSPRI